MFSFRSNDVSPFQRFHGTYLFTHLAFIAQVLFYSETALSQVNTDWTQPPIACVEEVVPKKPSQKCLDLSRVNDPKIDFPSDLSENELKYWQEPQQKATLAYCRATEILKREDLQPGSMTPGSVQTSWMRIQGTKRSQEKIDAIYSASLENKMPAQVLVGALMQESLFADMGIAEDGDNYSCGAGQVNVLEWCRWANKQSSVKKAEMNWPAAGANCSDLTTKMLEPFYQIAKSRLNGTPEYRLEKKHFSGIRFEDVKNKLSQKQHFELIISFINNCSEPTNGIAAKANELRTIFNLYVPSGLRAQGQYQNNERYQRICSQASYEKYHPVSVGWLLAVGIYNAGPRATDLMAHYFNWDTDAVKNPSTFENFNPTQLIESLYWGGKYSSRTDRIHFSTLQETETSWLWFKACVVQRHIARVVQHVTLPGAGKLVDTLEGTFKCAKSVFDPVSGDLVQSAVPTHRQGSSGRTTNSRNPR